MIALVSSVGPSRAMIAQVQKCAISAKRMPTPHSMTQVNSASFQRSQPGIGQAPPISPAAIATRTAINT